MDLVSKDPKQQLVMAERNKNNFFLGLMGVCVGERTRGWIGRGIH